MKITFRNEIGADRVIDELRQYGTVRRTKPTHADAQTIILHLPLPAMYSGPAMLECAASNRQAFEIINHFGIVIERSN